MSYIFRNWNKCRQDLWESVSMKDSTDENEAWNDMIDITQSNFQECSYAYVR